MREKVEEIEPMSITTIKQRDHELRAYINGFLSDPAHDDQSANSLLAEVFRRAAASLDAKTRKMFTCTGCGAEGLDEPLESKCHCNEDGAHWVESVIYTAPPEPVVPKELRELLGTLFNTDGRRGADFDLFDYLKARDDIVSLLQRNE